MSFKPQVATGSDPTFYGNALAFATHAEALQYAADLFNRWTISRDYRAIESTEPVTHTYIGGALRGLTPAPITAP